MVSQAKDRGIRVIPEYDVPGHQGRNMGVIDEVQWCGARPPASGDYQWELYDDPEGHTFSVTSQLYKELISLFPDECKFPLRPLCLPQPDSAAKSLPCRLPCGW